MASDRMISLILWKHYESTMKACFYDKSVQNYFKLSVNTIFKSVIVINQKNLVRTITEKFNKFIVFLKARLFQNIIFVKIIL